MRKIFYWVIPFALSLSIIVMYLQLTHKTKLGTVFITSANITSFVLFLVGFCVSLVLAAKEFLLFNFKKCPPKNWILCFFVCSLFSFIVGATTLSLVAGFPENKDYDTPEKVISYITQQTSMEYEPNTGFKFSLKKMTPEELSNSVGRIEEGTTKLLQALSISCQSVTKEFYMTVNLFCILCVCSILNLMMAAFFNLPSKTSDNEKKDSDMAKKAVSITNLNNKEDFSKIVIEKLKCTLDIKSEDYSKIAEGFWEKRDHVDGGVLLFIDVLTKMAKFHKKRSKAEKMGKSELESLVQLFSTNEDYIKFANRILAPKTGLSPNNSSLEPILELIKWLYGLFGE